MFNNTSFLLSYLFSVFTGLEHDDHAYLPSKAISYVTNWCNSLRQEFQSWALVIPILHVSTNICTKGDRVELN